jgi:hypothetical protein
MIQVSNSTAGEVRCTACGVALPPGRAVLLNLTGGAVYFCVDMAGCNARYEARTGVARQVATGDGTLYTCLLCRKPRLRAFPEATAPALCPVCEVRVRAAQKKAARGHAGISVGVLRFREFGREADWWPRDPQTA